MKRWSFGILLFAAVLLLPGCSGQKEQKKETKQQLPDYYVGVEPNNSPYFKKENGAEASGFYVDLMDALAEHAGFTYEFCEMSTVQYAAEAETDAEGSETGGQEKAGGSCDIFLGTFLTEAGDTSTYVQSAPIYETGLCLLTKKELKIKEMKLLRSKMIASRAMTEEELFSRYLSAKYEAENIVFGNKEEVMEDMNQGYSQAIVLDAGNAVAAMAEDSELKLLTTSEKYFSTHCFTSSKEKGIPEAISKALTEIQSDGTLNTLFQQYGF